MCRGDPTAQPASGLSVELDMQLTLRCVIAFIGWTTCISVVGGAAERVDYPPAYAPVVAEVRERQEGAQRLLAEWKSKAAALAVQQKRLEKELGQLAATLKEGDVPGVLAAARQRVVAAETRAAELQKALVAAKPGAFASVASMAEFDRLVDDHAAAISAIELARTGELRAVREVALRDPAGAQRVKAWEAREIERIAAANEASIAQSRRDGIVRSEGAVLEVIRPTRGATTRAAGAPPEAIEVPIAAPADAADRAAAFARRVSPEGVDELGRRFFSQMTLTLPGLQDVGAHVDAGRYGPALDAYKRYFFARLMEKPAAEAKAADTDGESSEGHSSRANMIFPPPTAAQVEDALAGVVRRSLAAKGGTKAFRAGLGQPGAMRWVFVTPELVKDHPDAEALLEFCRGLGFPGGTGEALLHSYAVGGPVEHLRHWAAITDDWAMNWQRDAEASPLAIRNYHLIYVTRIEEFRGRLRHIAMMRPAFVDDLPAATLARLLMAMNEEYLASAIRLGRSGLYNFRIMAHQSMIPTSLRMQEFHAHQWALREGWRQVHNNFIYKIRRDGANFEFANDGHENTDQFLHTTFKQFQQGAGKKADWLDPFWEQEFLDDFLANTRYRVHNLRPDGWCYRLSVRSQRERYLGGEPEYKVNLLQNEPEVRRRLWKVFGIGKPEPAPAVRSESMAFQGYYYLRSGWEREDEFLYFQNIGQPILSGREEAMGFSLYGGGVARLLAPPITVDGRVQNIHSALIENPGGKAPYAAYGWPDVVKDARFLSDERFDLVEGRFKGPYTFHHPKTEIDVFGSYGYESLLKRLQSQAEKNGKTVSTEPITDVTHARLLISVQGRQTYLVADFIESPQERQFTQNYTLFAPVRIDNLKQRLELLKVEGVTPVAADASAKTIVTRNIGLPNLRMRQFGEFPLQYVLTPEKRRDAAIAANGDLAAVYKGMPKVDRQHSELSKAAHFGQQIAVNWKGQGEQALLTVLTPQNKSYSPAGAADDLREVKPLALGSGAVGFTARYADGTPITFAASIKPRELALGTVRATARALLICGNDGLALDCTTIEWTGKAPSKTQPVTADFRFSITNGALAIGRPIHRPIQPVTIEPARGTFIESESVALACATPGVEIRYTLDGSRPTPASPLYAGPIRVEATCRLQARAFRKGVTQDVWQQDGTEATVVSSAVFKKEAPLRATEAGATVPGLKYEYFEGLWTELMVRSATMPAIAGGTVMRLLDVSARRTAGPFGMRYEGFIEIPRDGVYTFHAPREMMFPDNDCGYDLRVFVDGREWYPADRWHNHGLWSVALKQGKHPFKVIFTDLRPKPHKVELMWGFPHPDFTWKGKAPKLELSGPALPRGPVVEAMLSHQHAVAGVESPGKGVLAGRVP